MLTLDDEAEFVFSIREMMLVHSKTVKPRMQVHRLIDALSDRIDGLLEGGYAFDEIASILQQCNVQIAADDIKDYYVIANARRVAGCETFITRHYKSEWNETIARVAKIEKGLMKSLKEGKGLRLNYQPQVDVYSGRVVGAEALVRWEFEGNQYGPTEFIPVAEQSELIVQLGEWVLHNACKEAKRWEKMGLGGADGIKIGVNLSAHQFSSALPKMVHSALCDMGLSSRLLSLEITESFLAFEESHAILQTMHESGIHFSIDDFGTGYSCLAQVKNMPLDTIKIDRSFIQNLSFEKKSISMVETIIDLAEKFNMQTLAEGVENDAQVQILKKLGCSVYQGFHFAKPLSGDEFVRFVDRGLTS